jgi:hypothetical protein
MMVRFIAVVVVLSCLAASTGAQAQLAPGTAATQTGAPALKPAVKKPGPKNKITAKPPGPVENGPCQIGVISAIGDQFAVQKIGLTIFGNEYSEVPIDAWALDELVVGRVRAAAAPGTAVRRIAYPKGAFTAFDKPPPQLFRNVGDELATLVQQIAANASCERYVVVTKLTGKLDGTNQTLRGIGVFNHGTSLFSHSGLFANIQVTVFDGQTIALHKAPAVDLGSILAGGLARMTRDPLTTLDNALFPESAAAAANSATLRDRTRALLAANLDKTLPAYLKE